MTLYRQLSIYTIVLFLLLFIGTWFAKLHSTRTFLLDQLESHAQDTATSLGLSISPHISNNDMAVAESMINAVFDRGYYKVIRLIDNKGDVLIERVLNVTIESVPQWFVELVPLQTPDSEAKVMSGWLQAGGIFVKSHPGYAYKALWEAATRLTIWFLGMGILVAIVGGLSLRVLLKPLLLVEQQADALCRKTYEIQEVLPRTRELRRVVQAMNRMTGKVREMFEEQVGIAERLRKHAYQDTLTGLGNRRYFERQIAAHFDKGEEISRGALFLIQTHDLMRVNNEKGFEAGDQLLNKVATLLKNNAVEEVNCQLARLTGGDFGLFIPAISNDEAKSTAQTIVQDLSRLAAERLSLSENIGHLGGAIFEGHVSLGQLLSEADMALRAAQQKGPNSLELRIVSETSKRLPQGQQQWKASLLTALKDENVVLHGQPVVSCEVQHQIKHMEIFSRLLLDNNQLVSAAEFIPFAERLNIVSKLDRLMVRKVMELDIEQLGTETIAVNLSLGSIKDVSFMDWLFATLGQKSGKTRRLIFEFPEYGAVQNLDLVRGFAEKIRELGHGIGLDHYGQSFSNLRYLQALQPEFVKIDRAYTSELKEEDSDSRFFITSLCSVAHSIDIAVIGEGVENAPQRQLLTELNLDGMQGYYIEEPKLLG